MWARVVEFMLAWWIALSPFIFRYHERETFLWKSNLICACLIALFSLLSFSSRFRRAHLLTLLVALWMWGYGYKAFPMHALPIQQNSAVLGVLLLMLAIVPSHSQQLSPSWERFLNKKKK